MPGERGQAMANYRSVQGAGDIVQGTCDEAGASVLQKALVVKQSRRGGASWVLVTKRSWSHRLAGEDLARQIQRHSARVVGLAAPHVPLGSVEFRRFFPVFQQLCQPLLGVIQLSHESLDP
jgi:hypothetical protein